MKLLAFDTATEMCSVALWIDGELRVREQELAQGHGARLLPMIDALLAEAGIALNRLDALAFGRGPGGFTGVRLASSVAQGLAFGADLPVLPVSDLLGVAQRAFERHRAARRVLVCNDARMSEVYTALFERGIPQDLPRGVGAPIPVGPLDCVGKESVLPPARVTLDSSPLPTIGAGRGLRAYPLLRERLRASLLHLDDDLLPTAQSLIPQALVDWQSGRAVAAEAALPVYLRDNVAHPARA